MVATDGVGLESREMTTRSRSISWSSVFERTSTIASIDPWWSWNLSRSVYLWPWSEGLQVVITNQTESRKLSVPNHPTDSSRGSHELSLGHVIYIEQTGSSILIPLIRIRLPRGRTQGIQEAVSQQGGGTLARWMHPLVHQRRQRCPGENNG